MQHPGFTSIAEAKQSTLAWARAEGIPLHTIEYVATFEPWANGIGVWVFYETDANLQENGGSGRNSEIREHLFSALRAARYPSSEFPEVVFEFDSHENVVRTYEGSYFYRLR